MKGTVRRFRRSVGDGRGISLVELMVGAVLLSVLLLAVVRGFLATAKSFTVSRVKAQVTDFAQGEIDNLVRLAKSPSPLGEKAAYGYWHYVVSSPEQRVVYPRQLQILNQDMLPSRGVAPSGAAQRYELWREVTVTTFTADGDPVPAGADFAPARPGEYRQVVVSLRDTQSPERFPPLRMETLVRRPNPEALDMRQAVNAVVTGRVVDAGENPPRPLANAYLRVSPGDHVATTDGNGEFQFRQLNTYGIYTATVTAVDFWGHEVTFQAALQFPAVNRLPDIPLYPVRRAEVTVRVSEKRGNRELEGARVRLDHLGLMPTDRYPGTFSAVTDEDGEARFTIVIPEPGATEYRDKYAVTWVELEDYLEEPDPDENGRIEPLPFTLDVRRRARVDIEMTRVRTALLRVDVDGITSGALGPIERARVALLDNPHAPLFLKRWTDNNGAVTLTVPINTLEHKDADRRTVNVKIQRVGYVGHLIQNVELEVGRTERRAARLEPHRLVSFMENAAYRESTEASPRVLPAGAEEQVECRASYFGHTAVLGEDEGGTDLWCDENFEGSSDRQIRWRWNLLRGRDIRFASPDTERMMRVEAALHNDPAVFTCGTDYRFTYTGTEFGPHGTAPAVFVLPFTPSNPAYVRAIPAPEIGAPGDFAVTIRGYDTIDLGSWTWNEIVTNYPATSVRWLPVTGPGRLDSLTDPGTSLHPLAGAQVGDTITLMAEATSAIFGTRTSAPFQVRVTAPAPPPTTFWVGFTPDSETLYFRENFTLPMPNVQNASGAVSFEWVLVDAAGREMILERGYSPWGQLSAAPGLPATFQAFEREGAVTVRAKAVDAAGHRDYADFRVTVVPSGGGVTGG